MVFKLALLQFEAKWHWKLNNFCIVHIDNEYEKISHFDMKKTRPSFSTLPKRKGKHKTSWTVRDNFVITLCMLSGLNCDTKRNIEVIFVLLIIRSLFETYRFRLECK